MRREKGDLRVFILAVITVMVTFLGAFTAFADDKEWEHSISIGYQESAQKFVSLDGDRKSEKSGWLWGRALNRVNYPFLVGFGVNGAAIGDVVYGGVNAPISIRLGLSEATKLDIIGAAGAGYAKNTNIGLSKIVGEGTAGLELKRFVGDGVSIGVGAYYSAYTYSRLNNWKFGIVIGF